MKPIRIRDLQIGEGKPKICVPILGKCVDDIQDAAMQIAHSCADLVEWRVDWFEDCFEKQAIRSVLETLRHTLGEIPILFTFRSKAEGGEKEITYETYADLLLFVSKTKLVDMIDVEIFGCQDTSALVGEIQRNGTRVIGSNHDFHKTPHKEELVRRMETMEKAGVDIVKIAVMPRCKKDVLELLEATIEVEENSAVPLVTISMGEMGMISRMGGIFSGSAISFAAVGKASAPGQIEAETLRIMLESM